MAKSQYSGDSPFPSPISVHPGRSGGPEIIPVKPASFPAMPTIEASSVPAPYVLNGGAAMYIGKTVDCVSRLRDHGVADATPPLGGVSPTASID